MSAGYPSQIVLDHVTDVNGAELHRLATLHPLPDFVKHANLDETMRPSHVALSAYADPERKVYPCHNAASTFLSALYFTDKSAEYHQKKARWVRSRLDHFVEYWGIKAAVDAMQARHAELHKDADDALPDSDFGYVWVAETGLKERFLRMKNAQEVKAAAEYLFVHRDEIPYADRNVVAQKVLEKAARYGASLGEHDAFVERQAGRGLCEPAEVVQMIRDRAKIASDPVTKAALTKLAEQVKDKPRHTLNPDVLVKLATTIDTVDRGTGLAGRYTDVIKRPEDVLFRITYKEAQAGAGDTVALTTGNTYDRQDFKRVKLADIQAMLGNDVADAVSEGLSVDPVKLAEVAETFPRPDAELFERLLVETGVSPISAKSAADSFRLRPDALAAMAGSYR